MKSELKEMPVSQKVIDELKNSQTGDTTGCGDNFVGGIIASVVTQLQDGIKNPDLNEACSWGVVSGGFTCFYMGGTYFEEKPVKNWQQLEPYYESLQKQISG